MRLPRLVVRILPEDDDADLLRRDQLEGSKAQRLRRVDRDAGSLARGDMRLRAREGRLRGGVERAAPGLRERAQSLASRCIRLQVSQRAPPRACTCA